MPKGSLEKAVYDFLERAGYTLIGRERSYRPIIASDPYICVKILRPQEIPIYVYEGLYDIGITGIDWVLEQGVEDKVKLLLELGIGRVKLVLAVPRGSGYRSAEDLVRRFAEEKRILRISTEYLNTASRFISTRESYRKYYGSSRPLVITPWSRWGDNTMVQVILSFGATEAKPPEEADAIIDVSETGTTLESNGLEAIDMVLESQAVLIASPGSLSDPVKREKISDIVAIMRGVIDARSRYHIFINVKKKNLEELLKSLPALKSPTISPLADPEWVAINTVVGKDDLIRIMPILRRLAQGLVVYEPRLVIPLDDIGVGGGFEGVKNS
ncbi:MAG TPA: ATP phosphoribosyltransferase [Sulfolobales archaeon]|nr:ATP phosphoribosyltransferase [Sulfolobales archaeon]